VPQYRTDALIRRQDLERYDDRMDVRVNLIEAYSVLLEFFEKHMSDPFYLEATVRISPDSCSRVYRPRSRRTPSSRNSTRGFNPAVTPAGFSP